MKQRGIRLRMRVAMFIAAIICCTAGADFSSAQTCPLSAGTTDSAKSHKFFLYFPTADDNTFPNYAANVSPAKAFDVAGLNNAIGTTAALRDRIHDVVVDDYCEFNVQVLSTTTNPATMGSPPPRRVTVAVGSDNTGAWGQSQEVDIGDGINIDFARVWAGTYTSCEGGTGTPNQCSPAGELTGANATLDRWAQAIGGTAAHEGGHTYGLSHTDDDPPNDQGGQPGPNPLPGEDSFHKHLMPAGYNLSGADRATFRRHFSDGGYSLLAASVGLSIQTMHNWDMKNPNSASASSLAIDFLSLMPSITVSWSWTGASSPWITPTVSGPSGTAVFKGTTYKKYRITWSTGNPSWSGTPGVLPGGAQFHIGATFTGVDFNQPDAIIIQNVTLFDAGSNPLTLHPRLPAYDAGSVDAADGTFAVHFFPPPGAPQMRLQSAIVYQLPRVAALESMTGEGRPLTRDQQPIRPWSERKCAPAELRKREGARCVIAKLSQRPHVEVIHRVGEPGVYDCSKGVPRVEPPARVNGLDSPHAPDYEGPICAGTKRDLFPSTTFYIVATFVDPHAKHYDPVHKRMVTGPLTSKVYAQFSGVRDLREIGKYPPREEGPK